MKRDNFFRVAPLAHFFLPLLPVFEAHGEIGNQVDAARRLHGLPDQVDPQRGRRLIFQAQEFLLLFRLRLAQVAEVKMGYFLRMQLLVVLA